MLKGLSEFVSIIHHAGALTSSVEGKDSCTTILVGPEFEDAAVQVFRKYGAAREEKNDCT